MPLTTEQEQLVTQWNEAKAALQAAQELERKLRAAIVEQLSIPEQETGTTTIELPNDWKLKIEKNLDYKLENGNHELDDILKDWPEQIQDMLVRWKPELNVKNYKTLNDEYKNALGSVLTIKPSSPQVKLEAPKVKG
jgi:hypothetical protein